MPPTADADAVLAREQATEATALWAAGEFDAAHQTLQRIEAALPGDGRVQLNLWTAGYYADDSSSLGSVASELEAWLKACSKTSSSSTEEAADPSQDNSRAVAAINHGLLLYLQQQHASAQSLLEPLFEDVSVLQDGAALCLCVLLLEIYLDSCQLPKAVQVLEYLQGLCTLPGAAHLNTSSSSSSNPASPGRAGSSASSSSTNWAQQQQQQQERNRSRSPTKQPQNQQSPPKQAQNQQQQQDGPSTGNAAAGAPAQGPPNSQQEGGGGAAGGGAVVYLCDALPVVSKTRSHFMQEVDKLVLQQGGKLPSSDLTPLLHLYKARLALACNNHKAAKKEVRSLLAQQPDSPGGLLLKAQVEATRQQPRKVLKTLGPLLTGQQQLTSRCRLQLLNLLAAVHQQLGKHHLAALYLSTALNLHTEVQQEQQQQPQPQSPQAGSAPDPQQQHGKPPNKQQHQQKGKAAAAGPRGSEGKAAEHSPRARQSHWLVEDVSDAMFYNMGLQQLALQDWQGALESFEAASGKCCTMPQLWLRWAEACLGLHHQQQQQLVSLQQQEQQQQQEQAGTIAAAKGKSAVEATATTSANGQGPPTQQQLASSTQQLLQQAAAHINTGLALLQEQQAAAAQQLEAATAAAVAAIAAGEPLPEPGGQPWPVTAAALAASGSAAAVAAAAVSGSGANGAQELTGAPSSSAAAGPSASAEGSSLTQQQPAGPGAVQTASGSAVSPAVGPAAAWPPPESVAWLAPELAAVKQSLLANKAFVALLLGQPSEALAAAEELLACSSMSPHQHYLGSLYAAEALCLLGRPAEAQQQLQLHIQGFMHQGVGGGSSGSGSGVAHVSLPAPAAAGGSTAPASGTTTSAAAPAASGNVPAVASSIKSHDGSISCSRGGPAAAAAGLGPQDQALLLHDLAAVLVMQGDLQGAQQHAALAAALAAAAQQDAAGAVAREGGVLQ